MSACARIVVVFPPTSFFPCNCDLYNLVAELDKQQSFGQLCVYVLYAGVETILTLCLVLDILSVLDIASSSCGSIATTIIREYLSYSIRVSLCWHLPNL